MARGGQVPLREPPFSVPALHPEHALPATDMQAGPWVLFTSRHEQLHAALDPQIKIKHEQSDNDQHSQAHEDSPSLDESLLSSDSEVEAVRADEELEHESEPTLWVCNGPWSALHRVTAESASVYQEGGSLDALTLKPRCGCKLGVAALAVLATYPANACKRKGCR